MNPPTSYRDEMSLTRKIGSLRYFYSASYFFSAILVIVSAIVPHALSKVLFPLAFINVYTFLFTCDVFYEVSICIVCYLL